MNELFQKAGAVDAYVAVHGMSVGGETIDWFNNSTYRYFWPNANPVNPDVLARIDYVYVKPTGGGLSLTPTNAFVIRNWKLEPNHEDVSDHYPVVVDVRLKSEPSCHDPGALELFGNGRMARPGAVLERLEWRERNR